MRAEHSYHLGRGPVHGKELLQRAAVSSHPELAGIAEQFDNLILSVGPTDFSRAVEAVRNADEMVTAGKSGEAEQLCRDALRSDCLTV
ncbi:MAG: hypothetical protein QOE61_5403 [Micromonosporaceae bacterium]|nr:hypothetical protein [Micromonosporaceae bacterium]